MFTVTLAVALLVDSTASQEPMPVQGNWAAALESPGGPLQFRLEIGGTDADPTATIVNGPERIIVPRVTVSGRKLVLAFPHYDSQVTAELSQRTLRGQWVKRRRERTTQMTFEATRVKSSVPLRPAGPAADYAGRWEVDFSKSDDPAVALFRSSTEHGLWGTFLTTTGDYRFLSGRIPAAGTVEFSVFDGAHAFLFRAVHQPDSSLRGDFWSSENWHETWTARKTRTPNCLMRSCSRACCRTST